MKHLPLSSMHWLLMAAAAMGLAACASIGRPQGGPKDTEPPKFVSSTPGPEARNVSKQKIDIFFNENVQLQDAFNKVIVSPVQKTNPVINANGKHVSVELKDTLLPNTTYTIDFGDAIKDLNEGNILDGFTTAFSTGDSIDSLRISGIVLEARTLEPAQGMLVGVYSNLSDTAIRTLPFERVTRTNQLGQFTIHNLKPGQYRVFALNDINRDYFWDRTEDVAFYDSLITPYSTAIEVVDTLRAYDGGDSLATRAGRAYFPNDILLTWFNEGYKSQYLKDYARPDRRRITIGMGAPADTLPEITIAKGPMAGRSIDEWALLRKNETLDTLTYWIKDTTVLATDSLLLSVRYLRTDTANALTWKADTLKFFFKDPKPKDEKKKKAEEEADTLPPKPTFMGLTAVTSTSHELNMPIIIETNQPIDTILAEGVHLDMLVDTLWTPVPDIALAVDSIDPLTRRRLYLPWIEGQKYRLTVDSAAAVGIYDQWNDAFKHEFTVKTAEEYANLIFKIQGVQNDAVVELLDKSEKVLAVAPVVNGEAVMEYLKPGTVFARLYIDSNANGKWDTGNIADSIQPEEVYYFPKKLNLRKNWDVTQDWNIYETPVDMQKPWDIKKNKPKLKDGERAPGQTDDEEEEDDGGFGYGGYGTSSYGRGSGSGNRGSGNRGQGGMGGFGGFGGPTGGAGMGTIRR